MMLDGRLEVNRMMLVAASDYKWKQSNGDNLV